ncbi:Nitrogen regulatory protein [compost metagenome]
MSTFSSHFARYLIAENVFLNLAAANKLQAFALIASRLQCNEQLNRRLVYEKLCARENMDSTGLGSGVAIPHAQVPGLRHPIAAFARLQQAIAYVAPDEQPVSELFVLLLPVKTTRAHLQILADIAELLCDPQFRQQLNQAQQVDAIMTSFQHTALSA